MSVNSIIFSSQYIQFIFSFLEWMRRNDVQKTICASIPDNLWKCVRYLSDVLGMILVDRTTQGDREGWQTSAPTRDSKTPHNRVHSQLPTRLQTLPKMCLYRSPMIPEVNSNLYCIFPFFLLFLYVYEMQRITKVFLMSCMGIIYKPPII